MTTVGPVLTDVLSEEEREILDYMLQNDRQEEVSKDRIPVRDTSMDAPLSFGQQRSWLVHELNRDQPSPYDTLNIQLRLRGTLAFDALACSIREIARRHEVLRTVFVLRNGEPVQLVQDALPEPERIDISDLPETERESRLAELLQQAEGTLFDLAEGPLFRVRLIRLDTSDHVLVMMMHHIIFDGWSKTIVVRELKQLYESYLHGQPSPLPDLPVQYRDFSVWQRNRMQGHYLQKQLDYWTGQLSGLPALELPTDRPRPSVQTFNGSAETLVLPADLSTALSELSWQRGATLYITMLAALGVLLYRYSSQKDIGIGTVITNRDREELQDLVGFFLNTLVMRLDLSDEPSFGELLERVKRTTNEAYAHQHLPFERLVDEMQVERDRSRSPLFQVIFYMLGEPDKTPLQLKGLDVETLDTDAQTTRFDLEFYILAESPEEMALGFLYNTSLFDADTIRGMLEHYRNLLESIVADLDCPIGRLPMQGDEERHRILVEWNATRQEFPAVGNLAELFEQQVDRSPDAIAVEFRDEALTYRELDERCNRLAHYLIERGAGPEKLVGVYMERSLEMVVALLGILKAGSAYVPLDPEYPPSRIESMLQDARTPLLLCQQHLRDRLPAGNTVTICCDSEWNDIAASQPNRPVSGVAPDNLAYVIFTSGSTGKPKGVMNEHRGVINRLLWMQSQYGLGSEDRVLQKTPYSFDVSVWEFFWPLTAGARLVVAEPGGHRDASYVADIMDRRCISTVHFVPSMLKACVEHADMAWPTSLKHVICSGEALSPELQQRFFRASGAGLHNLYGPTEAAIDVTAWACRRDNDRDTVPIGRPIANTAIYILDKYMQPVPAGVPGELCIGGVQVARGYLNRPDLTEEKFVPDALSGETNARLYRTGDIARYRHDGNIEYLGRRDHQVKLRGFRIELDEIRSVLEQHPAVKAAAVSCREDPGIEPRLVAYIVAEENGDAPAAVDLRSLLQAQLPPYMVPHHFVVLDALPLTTSGKLDRRALPEPQEDSAPRGEFTAPETEMERKLAAVWEAVLPVSSVGATDNFFDLGGHSLMATRVITRIREIEDLDLSVAVLFDNPTVAALADYIETTRWVLQSRAEPNSNEEEQRQIGEL